MRQPVLASLFVAGSLVGLSMASCQDATQVGVEARTNLAPREGLVVTFTVGAPRETELAEVTTETVKTWGPDGFVGSLTVVPTDGKDAPVSVKLVLGLRRASRECAPPDYRGCIVARRQLRFIPQTRLRLPITLFARCEDVPCTADTTCNALGACVPAAVDPERCAEPEGCGIDGDPPIGRMPDSGLITVSDASSDAIEDGPFTPLLDAGDAGDGATLSDGGGIFTGKVSCGETTCEGPFDVCCYRVNTGEGVCQPLDVPCPSQHARMTCDGPEDCPGALPVCCAASYEAVCRSSCPYVTLCHSSMDCAVGGCSGLYYGTYPSCQ